MAVSQELTDVEKAEARLLADSYIIACGRGGEELDRVRQQMVTVSKPVSDAMAEHYAARMRAGNQEISHVLGNQLEAMWFETGRQILLAARLDHRRGAVSTSPLT